MPQIVEEEIINLGTENGTPIINFNDFLIDISSDSDESDIYLSDSDCTIYKEDIMDCYSSIKGQLKYNKKRPVIEILEDNNDIIEPPNRRQRQNDDDVEIIHIRETPHLRRQTRIGTLRNGNIIWNNVNRDMSFTFTYPVNNNIILDEDDDDRDAYIPTSSDILSSIINTNRNRNNN